MNVFQKEDADESRLDPESAVCSLNIECPPLEESVNWGSLFEAEAEEYHLVLHAHTQPCHISFSGSCIW